MCLICFSLQQINLNMILCIMNPYFLILYKMCIFAFFVFFANCFLRTFVCVVGAVLYSARTYLFFWAIDYVKEEFAHLTDIFLFLLSNDLQNSSSSREVKVKVPGHFVYLLVGDIKRGYLRLCLLSSTDRKQQMFRL